MASVIPSIPPGRYPEASEVTWEFAQTVQQVAYTINGLPPVLSEYIAYDQLTPPNPFIAVTQDGRGNVLYDGGFPKLYNTQNTSGNEATVFSELTPAQKYFHNAINWCANPDTVAQYGKRILILGDANEGENYNIIGTAGNHFRSTIEAICRVVGYTPTYRTRSHWGTQIDCTLSEITQYACIFFFSTSSPDVDRITDNAVQDILTYRSLGGGLIFITDHGAVIDDIENAWPVTGGSFFRTANKIIRNFGAWFSGDYNRTPVNVGFLRDTYGDHPLYNDITDAESIYAGGSESRVFVNIIDTISPSEMPTIPITDGETRVQVLVRLEDGRVETYNLMYDVSQDIEILTFTDLNDVPVTEVGVGWDNSVALKLDVNGEGQATLLGGIYRNTTKIGEFRYDQNTGSRVTWYLGEGVPNYVDNGDRIRAVIEQPYTYEKSVLVHRNQLTPLTKVSTASVVKSLDPLLPEIQVRQRIAQALTEINKVQSVNYTRRHAANVQGLLQYMDGTYPHFEVQAYAYDDPVALAEALQGNIPLSLREIFDTWDRASGNDYYPGGVGATGDVAAWYWNDTLQAAIQPVNTRDFVSFLSDEKPLSYDVAVTFASTGGDDDFNALVLAFHRDEQTGLNHTLSLQICRSGTGWQGTPYPNFAVVVDAHTRNNPVVSPLNNGRYRTVVSNDFDEQTGNWSGRSYRVWASRRGDQFTIYGSGWTDLTQKPESLMTFNLNDDPDLAVFKQPLQYGFASQSQANSRFEDIEYISGFNRNVILDMINQRIYSWYDNQWNLVSGATLHGVFKPPRVITSVTTGKRFQLNLDGTITFLN